MYNLPEHIQKLFLLVRKRLSEDKLDMPVILPEQYRQIFSAASEQGVLAIVWDAMQALFVDKALSKECRPDRALLLNWALNVERIEKLYESQYQKASELAAIYADYGIRTIVMKGISASTWYPIPNHRPCGDLDCFLLGAYEKGNEIALMQGAEVDLIHYKHSHIKYKGLPIDNHQYLTHVKGSRRAKDFEKLLQNILYTTEGRRINDTSLEEPPSLFHALFLTYHAHHHFLVEGIRLRHLTDWAMFVNKYGEEIDWQYFNEISRRHGMKPFADSMMRLSRDVVGVTIPSLYSIAEDRNRDAYLLNDMFYADEKINNSSLPHWRRRVKVLFSYWNNRKKYQLFSDKTFISALIIAVFGFFFDKDI